MKNIRHEIARWVQAALFIGLWMLLVYLSDATSAISLAALARIPDVVFIYGVLYLVFIKWLWRLPVFKGWLIPFPGFGGHMEGHNQEHMG